MESRAVSFSQNGLRPAPTPIPESMSLPSLAPSTAPRQHASLPRYGHVPDQHGGIAQPACETAAVGEERERPHASGDVADAVALLAGGRLEHSDFVGGAGRGREAAAVRRERD